MCAGIFTILYGSLKGTGLFSEMFGGKTTLAGPGENMVVELVVAAAFVIVARFLPDRLR